MIGSRRGRKQIRPAFVAFAAHYRPMSAGKLEPDLPVSNKCKAGWHKTFFRVAFFTLVFVGRTVELSAMNIAVASRTGQVVEAIDGLLRTAHMALGTSQRAMFSQQGKSALHVALKRESCRFETFHGMTGSAITTTLALAELPSVWILFVAIEALGVRHQGFEIGAGVAGVARQRRMLAFEREDGGSMIENRDYLLRFPVDGLVTGIA